jgi:hypothetical protein
MRIIIDINCNEKTCGSCRYKRSSTGIFSCLIFRQYLPLNNDNDFDRLPECINTVIQDDIESHICIGEPPF